MPPLAEGLQWVATVDQVLTVLGHTNRVGEQRYFIGRRTSANAVFVVTKLRKPKAGYFVEDYKVYRITENQYRTFLTNRGETLPAKTFMFIKSSSANRVFDELWLTDRSLARRL